jgi:hypothetical protein
MHPQSGLTSCNAQKTQLQAQLQAVGMSYAGQLNNCQSSLYGCNNALTSCQQAAGR